jgi:hypothetical protein
MTRSTGIRLTTVKTIELVAAPRNDSCNDDIDEYIALCFVEPARDLEIAFPRVRRN